MSLYYGASGCSVKSWLLILMVFVVPVVALSGVYLD
jgi:hypothetical protein